MTSRLSFAISTVNNAELGEPDDGPAVAAEHQIEEEIAEIKRYEVHSPASPRCKSGLTLPLEERRPERYSANALCA